MSSSRPAGLVALVCGAAIIIGGGAQGAERVVEMKKPAGWARDIDAYPRIARPADDAEKKINAAVARLDGRVKKAVAECKSLAGGNADWTRTIEVTMRGPRYLSYVVTDNSNCGGAHPNVASTAIVYDLATGAPVDWAKLLPGKLLGKVALGDAGDGTKMITLASQRLYDLYMAQYRAGERRGDKECTAAMAQLGGGGSPPAIAPYLDAATGGLGVVVDAPHVLQTCADQMVIPPATLRAEGVSEATLKAIEAAKAAWK
ncbi:MAG TPA: hypothetical protein PKA55_10895 [Rhodoblastus sp.]|nr:hypothetical protein [Rhodoblastus sp.]